MIKPNELRIGNFILDEDGDVMEVTQISNMTVQHPKGLYSIISTIKPIPLTEEWLLKFGFEIVVKNAEKNNILLHYHRINKTYDFLLNEPHSNKYNTTKLEYVHQLQNLYFALTGEELTTK